MLCSLSWVPWSIFIFLCFRFRSRFRSLDLLVLELFLGFSVTDSLLVLLCLKALCLARWLLSFLIWKRDLFVVSPVLLRSFLRLGWRWCRFGLPPRPSPWDLCLDMVLWIFANGVYLPAWYLRLKSSTPLATCHLNGITLNTINQECLNTIQQLNTECSH